MNKKITKNERHTQFMLGILGDSIGVDVTQLWCDLYGVRRANDERGGVGKNRKKEERRGL